MSSELLKRMQRLALSGFEKEMKRGGMFMTESYSVKRGGMHAVIVTLLSQEGSYRVNECFFERAMD